MLLNLTVKDKDYIKRLGGRDLFEFSRGINILAGPNGSGKSSLFSLILNIYPEGKFKTQTTEEVSVRFLDTENSPRNSGSNLFMHKNTFLFQALSHWKSHGETMSQLVLGVKQVIKPEGSTLIMIDEPETALDFKTLNRFIREIKKIVTEHSSVQFLIASHHPLIWMIPGAKIIVMGKDKDYVENTLKSFYKLFKSKR